MPTAKMETIRAVGFAGLVLGFGPQARSIKLNDTLSMDNYGQVRNAYMWCTTARGQSEKKRTKKKDLTLY